jgi:hypothetical protein
MNRYSYFINREVIEFSAEVAKKLVLARDRAVPLRGILISCRQEDGP